MLLKYTVWAFHKRGLQSMFTFYSLAVARGSLDSTIAYTSLTTFYFLPQSLHESTLPYCTSFLRTVHSNNTSAPTCKKLHPTSNVEDGGWSDEEEEEHGAYGEEGEEDGEPHQHGSGHGRRVQKGGEVIQLATALQTTNTTSSNQTPLPQTKVTCRKSK